MPWYNINLKQLKNCGLSLNDKTKYKNKTICVMGGPIDIIDIYVDNDGVSMWHMLADVCHSYSEYNSWERTLNLSGKSVFKNIRNNLLTKTYYDSIKDKIKKIEDEEQKIEDEEN